MFNLNTDAQTNNATIEQAKVLIENEQYAIAIKNLNQLLLIEPNNFKALVERARACYLVNDFSDAVKDANLVLTLDPKNVQAINILGLVKFDNNQLDESLTYFNQTVLYDATFFKGYLNIARVYKEKKAYQNAILNYSNALKAQPKLFIAAYQIGLIYWNKLYKSDSALVYYSKTIDINPNFDSAYVERGSILYNNDYKNYAGAKTDFLKALELNPKYEEAYQRLSYLYGTIEKDYNKELQTLSTAIQNIPNSRKLYLNRADFYMKLPADEKNYFKALEDCSKAIAIDPNYYYPYMERGKIYLHLQNKEKAIADFRTSLNFFKAAKNDYSGNDIGLKIDLAALGEKEGQEDVVKLQQRIADGNLMNKKLNAATEELQQINPLIKNYMSSDDKSSQNQYLNEAKHHLELANEYINEADKFDVNKSNLAFSISTYRQWISEYTAYIDKSMIYKNSIAEGYKQASNESSINNQNATTRNANSGKQVKKNCPFCNGTGKTRSASYYGNASNSDKSKGIYQGEYHTGETTICAFCKGKGYYFLGSE
jgi:tetratricopeptide (TPR) repeat protein